MYTYFQFFVAFIPVFQGIWILENLFTLCHYIFDKTETLNVRKKYFDDKNDE